MATQTATTGDLDQAQNIVIAACRFTAEHNAPCVKLIENFKLGQGEKSMTVPKVGQMTAQALSDGDDLVASEDIGMTYKSLTTTEVGLKVILTKKLLRQFNEDVFKMVGRQMGDALARKKNRDVIALFSALNSGTALGADNATLGLAQLEGCLAWAKTAKCARVNVVHHPNAIGALLKSAAGVGNSYYAGLIGGDAETEAVLRRYWAMQLAGANVFQTGDIDKIAGVDSGYGAIFDPAAMCFIESLAPEVEREEDKSLRAWEVLLFSDYGVFELDDSMGAPIRYEIGTMVTS